MAIMFLPPRTVVVNVASATDYNLYTAAGSLKEPVACHVTVTGTVSASNISTPAFTVGSDWNAASWIHILNSGTIVGATGRTGSTGSNGSVTSGAGGAGGIGGGWNASRVAFSPTAGSSGGNGVAQSGLSANGGNGYAGGDGGIAFLGTNSNRIVTCLKNYGNITGGAGGIGGAGGTGATAPGGGGGGGGGACGRNGPVGGGSTTYISGGGGGGGSGSTGGLGGHSGWWQYSVSTANQPTITDNLIGGNGSSFTYGAGGSRDYSNFNTNYFNGNGGRGGNREENGTVGGYSTKTDGGTFWTLAITPGVGNSFGAAGGVKGTTLVGTNGATGASGSRGYSVSNDSNITWLNLGTVNGTKV